MLPDPSDQNAARTHLDHRFPFRANDDRRNRCIRHTAKQGVLIRVHRAVPSESRGHAERMLMGQDAAVCENQPISVVSRP